MMQSVMREKFAERNRRGKEVKKKTEKEMKMEMVGERK